MVYSPLKILPLIVLAAAGLINASAIAISFIVFGFIVLNTFIIALDSECVIPIFSPLSNNLYTFHHLKGNLL